MNHYQVITTIFHDEYFHFITIYTYSLPNKSHALNNSILQVKGAFTGYPLVCICLSIKLPVLKPAAWIKHVSDLENTSSWFYFSLLHSGSHSHPWIFLHFTWKLVYLMLFMVLKMDNHKYVWNDCLSFFILRSCTAFLSCWR